MDLTAVGLGRFWRNSGEQKDKNLPGYSPHLIYKVTGSALLKRKDFFAEKDGRSINVCAAF